MPKNYRSQAKERTRRTKAKENLSHQMPEGTKNPYREAVYSTYVDTNGRVQHLLIGYRNDPEGPVYFA